MKGLAIITARGGSKRIPRKNIRPFLGRPIIEYSIEAALKSNLFDEVMVSTDDLEIKQISEGAGASVPFMRSAKNSDDFATTSEVILEVLDSYKKRGLVFDYVCCIYPTAPFVGPSLLLKAFEKLSSGKFDLVLPVTSFSYPVQRSFLLKEDGGIKYSMPEHINSRSQDLEKHYHDAGQFYFIEVSEYLSRGTLVSDKMGSIEVGELEVQDIDTESDWKLAEIKYQLTNL